MNPFFEGIKDPVKVITFEKMAKTARVLILDSGDYYVNMAMAPEYSSFFASEAENSGLVQHTEYRFLLKNGIYLHEFLRNLEQVKELKSYTVNDLSDLIEQQIHLHKDNIMPSDTLVWLSPRMYLMCRLEDILVARTYAYESPRTTVFIQSKNFRLINVRRPFDMDLIKRRRNFK